MIIDVIYTMIFENEREKNEWKKSVVKTQQKATILYERWVDRDC